MTSYTAQTLSPHDPLLVDRGGLARLLRCSPSYVNDLLGDAAWLHGDLPTPVRIGPDSHRGPGYGRLAFRLTTVDSWLVEAQRRTGGQVRSPLPASILRATTLHTRDLAGVLAVPYDTMRKWCGSCAIWNDGDLPSPISIGRHAHLAGAGRSSAARGPGQRRWRLTEVEAWLAAREQDVRAGMVA